MAIDTIIPVISHLYLGFNGIISCISRIVDFIENVYHIRVWKALSKCTNFSDGIVHHQATSPKQLTDAVSTSQPVSATASGSGAESIYHGISKL